ncbi:MAG: mechanosensitive ion channel family protein [Candidatus Enterenecus sp.]
MPHITLTTVGGLQELLKTSIAGFAVEKLLVAIVTAVVCLVVIKVLLKLADRLLSRMTHVDATVKGLIRAAVKVLLLFIGVIVVMGCLGIPVTSLVAVLSVVGLALSLAVQNFLSNVAGGLQMLVSKPFKVGDYVEAGGCSGTVREMGLFYTKLDTVDNKLVQIPNSAIAGANIVNYSAEPRRRVDITVSASYDAPTDKVREILTRLVGEHPLTLPTPEPMIRVSAYGDSAIEYTVRAWCATEDYWTVYFDLMDGIKPAFDKAGIEMTYPHVNVHMMEK